MIYIENLEKSYQKQKVLNGITLEMHPGEVLGLVGPNGSGKTTLLRLVAGLEPPDKGRICIGGHQVSAPQVMVPAHERRLSMIFQELALWPHMTVRKNMKFVMEGQGHSRDEFDQKIKMILQEVGLDGYRHRYPHQLSGGEKQRLAIARAIASDPEYLLMDEPFSSLDPILKEDLKPLVINLKQNRRMGIVYVSHNTEEVLALADRIAVIHNGKIEQVGTKQQVLASPETEFVRRFFKLQTS